MSDLFIDELRGLLGEDAVHDRPIDIHAAAHDASHYLLMPTGVVRAESAKQVADILSYANGRSQPVTFRSGGTSLSGQASTEALQIDTRAGFRAMSIEDDGIRVRVQPGATINQVNARLARYGRKLGPDPASSVACTIGGVVANNSSGMACGTVHNTYKTIESMTFVLADGTTIDTADARADELLASARPELHAKLGEIRDRVRHDAESMATIKHLFSMKNTIGYGVNSLVDYNRPVDILAHLLIGSEGTLGFVAEAVFVTVPAYTDVATGLLVFENLNDATSSLPALVATEPAAIELMDAASLRVAQQTPDPAAGIAELDVVDHAALLVEYQEPNQEVVAQKKAAAEAVAATLPLASPAVFSADPVTRASLWKIRNGLYATIAGARASGTTALLEDIAVPVERLAGTCMQLTDLFEAHGYEDSVIFGHAKDGNIHFMITDRFDTAEGQQRLAAFTEDMVDLVLREGGVLKAEHGTGRAMAPFVNRQYGDELYAVMWAIKRACDPQEILNPGVLLSNRDDAHLHGIKTTVTVESEVDRCVECGYCEPVCPSRNLTLTPRQRIALRRDMAKAQAAGDTELADSLAEAYRYAGIDTCAVDGMCQTTCPMRINTADLVRHLRADGARQPLAGGWNAAQKKWGVVTTAASAALSVAKAVPVPKLVNGVTKAAREVIGEDTMPEWTADLPAGGTRRGKIADSYPADEADLVYIPSCQSAMFGPADGGPGLQRSFQELCAEAGLKVHIPRNIDSLCCGTPWSSKGYLKGKEQMRRRVIGAVVKASREGELPIVCDASSCTEGFIGLLQDAPSARPLRIVDGVVFLRDEVLPRLGILRHVPSVTLHPTCATTHLGSTPALLDVAGAIADDVRLPDNWGCCAFAGDRGMLHPELTASATAPEAADVEALNSTVHASANRACELGMTRATGKPYKGIIELVADSVAGR
ncbi:MAG: FAD-binding and (Fe-S)-binding domain-containing protein [Ancrocorticia sp.]|uniref:FAD-binding and (Fe-S)-binding domain-containing protein n=1 Tax=Ancrocorticia sp. TaxID=2593684 RepID=UPI003F8F8E5B